MSKNEGVIYRISGPVVTATGIDARMYEVVRVGHEKLMGEVIEIHGEAKNFTSLLRCACIKQIQLSINEHEQEIPVQ